MGSSKGQSANELLVIYMFVMLIFTVFVATFSQQRSAEMERSKIASADSVGEQFSYELNLAARAGSGYSRRIVYPVLLDGVTPYTIILNNISKSIDIQFSLGTANYSHSFPVITDSVMVIPQINATLPDGTEYGYVVQSSNESYPGGRVYVQNVNGMIVISPVPAYSPNPSRITKMNISGLYETPQGIEFANITATVTDSFGEFVPDGTLVNFQAFSGTINEFATTVNGTAMASLTTSSATTVIASVSGVSSSIDVPYS
jgi:hypothetical protein